MAAYVQDSIMLLGDSLTQAHVYNRKMDVVNRGFSGYNTDWILPVFDQVFATKEQQQHLPKVRLLVIWFGANDAALPVRDQHVPLERYKANLAHLITAVRSPDSPRHSPDTRIVLMTAPLVNTHQWGVRQAERGNVMDRDFETTRTYAAAAKELGAAKGVPVVDLWTKIYDAAGQEEAALSGFMTDGLHLNRDGYQIVFDELIKTTTANFPEYHYENFKFVFVTSVV
ncbi:SGNH hydrolase [Epithele typhae]|uniref:SGNH hydrolase n=1 Tax=Epithele typhae TaxID=378194 RepID=UPI002008C570|nr:SGNH hydrolase [Epithele typhae]KAH9923983.1 SGNH hydrolase [Epithele typhae]